MTDVNTLLAGIKTRAEQVPECNEDCGMVSCRTLKDRDRLIHALEAVAGLHKPLDVFEYDDTNGVFKLDEDGEQIPAGSFCQECSDPDVIQSIEDCEYDTSGGYGEVSWPCPTITAVTAALGGGE